MGAIVVAIVGVLAVGLVGMIIVFAAMGIAGSKAINAMHDTGQWWLNRRSRRHH